MKVSHTLKSVECDVRFDAVARHTYLSDLLLRTLVVLRRQQSESIEAALDIME